MRTLQMLFIVILLATIISLPAAAEITITKADYPPNSYDITWDGEFADVLSRIYTECGSESFAMITDKDTITETKTEKGEMPSLLAVMVSYPYNRSFMWVGNVPVFTPSPLPSMDEACRMYSGKLIASLSPEQRETHKSSGGVPFSELTEEQKSMVAFLSRYCENTPPCPEPEFTKRLQDSRVVVMLSPGILYNFEYCDTDGRQQKTYERAACSSESRLKLIWDAGPMQMSAKKMFSNFMTSPGSDVPGDSRTHTLNGTYTLADLLKMIDPAGFSTEADADSVLISAHCEMTGAAIARACSVATFMTWRRDRGGWHLAHDDTYKKLKESEDAAAKSGTYRKEFEDCVPAIKQMASSGEMKLLFDDPWPGNFGLQFILGEGFMKWDDFNQSQQEYLKERNKRVYIPELPESDIYKGQTPNLPTCTYRWNPMLDLYIMNGDGILYHDYMHLWPVRPQELYKNAEPAPQT